MIFGSAGEGADGRCDAEERRGPPPFPMRINLHDYERRAARAMAPSGRPPTRAPVEGPMPIADRAKGEWEREGL